jgi:glycosyltransferase involved in cell wall biosynthesis
MLEESLVSVIIPTFNRCRSLKRAILSAIGQSYNNIEILVISDGSTDTTSETVSSIEDNRVKYFQHEKNKGLVATRNTGLKKSSGEFITFLDDDDEWSPEKISKQLAVFKDIGTSLGMVFTNGYSEYENDCFIRGGMPSGIIYHPKKDHFFPLRVLIPPPSSWMLPKSIMDEIGNFDENMRNHWDDGDYLVRLALKYPIYFLNEKLVLWHALENHLETISPTLIKDKDIFFKKNCEIMKKDKEYFFRFCRALGKDAISIDKDIAREYLFKAMRMKFFDSSTISKILRTYSNRSEN